MTSPSLTDARLRARRHNSLAATVLVSAFVSLGRISAFAQDASSATEFVRHPRRWHGRKAAMRATAAFTMAGAIVLGTDVFDRAHAQSSVTELPEVSVTASRIGTGVVGTSTSIITAEEIARSPAATIPEILANEPGIQTSSTYGGVNGAQTMVDLRGFGAFATQNALVLINGRRVNDLDLDSINFAAIPKNSIERIEIIRGNSGAVLYGDNAVGGVINIVTKTGVGTPPSARVEAAYGSFRQRELAGSVNTSSGPWSASAYANAVRSDGWRQNNKLRQDNGVGEVRYTVDDFSAFLNVTADEQQLGFPGARLVTPTSSELSSDPRGTSTPYDYGDRRNASLTTGFTRRFDSVELIIDGGIRQKTQQAGFFSSWGSIYDSYADTTLTMASFTPRAIVTHPFLGLPSKLIAGVDFNRADYQSDRSQENGFSPIHHYDIVQNSAALYAQETLTVRPDTDLSLGGRLHFNNLSAHDTYDPSAPGVAGSSAPGQASPLDKRENQYALHAGVEHRFNPIWTGFGRVARSFRFPNVDERVGLGRWDGTFMPTNFDLKTQTSHDAEVGLKFAWGRLSGQSSVYVMDLTNEIHYDPVNGFNYNLDPTRRYGSETSAAYRLSDTVRLKGGLTYTRAVFREGTYTGNDVPLVSRWTGSAGFSWDVWQKWLTLDATLRYVGKRRMDNDQANFQPMIPARFILDLKVGGEIDRFFWSASFRNAFTDYYYDYAIASTATSGRYNAYPLPGRTYMLRAGLKF